MERRTMPAPSGLYEWVHRIGDSASTVSHAIFSFFVSFGHLDVVVGVGI